MNRPTVGTTGDWRLVGARRPGAGDLGTDPLLLPVVNEFNLMQQQMFDQFHQTLLIMAEMFTTLHKEQAGLVREELEHLRRLTAS